MADFRFANPQYIHVMWLALGLVAALIWFDRRGGQALGRVLSPSMQSRLVHRLPRGRRWLGIALVGLAAAAMVIALMRPQWGRTYIRAPRVGAQLMFCVDVSKSMLAEDTAPNRLERAKADITDLLSFLDGDQVGLIAFAGKATVLCPLTTDFGFFRMVLEEAGPHSVGRGGTRLEEPIRKALEGFRTESDVSRLIVLITDGEDHDSFPLEAAKAAAERGIKIIAIGFGDEAGSRIQLTDSRTGARTEFRDGQGNAVVTRLDGTTLREIALRTDGAYIPAGTGTLDLASIHKAHLAPAVRGELEDRRHAVHGERFQWPVLIALLLLVCSVMVSSGSATSRFGEAAIAPASLRRADAAAILLTLVAFAPESAAQNLNQEPASGPDSAEVSRADEKPAAPSSLTSPRDGNEGDARTSYNQALALLGNDLNRAETFLARARRDAGTDGQVRFRATYNLGWVEVKRADQLLEDNPREALAHLHRAADWFRDAVRLRPDHRDARHNLEVILRRAIQLADSLANEGVLELADRLDELIDRQRKLLGDAGQLIEELATVDDPNATDRFRPQFHALAVQQRTILSDSQAVVKSASEELEALESKKQQERQPDEQLRAAQLANLLHYANRANQRMGQARSQMRRRQGQPAYRRASASLSELKRARDQLRNPVEVLAVLLADSTPLVGFTRQLATATDVSPDAQPSVPSAPPWLTREYLEETQASIAERTGELEGRLAAGLKEEDSRPLGPPEPNEKPPDPQVERFLSMVRQAMPFITEGKEAFQAALEALRSNSLDVASRRQVEAVRALREAHERFLDLRGLIELTYAQQVHVQRLVSTGRGENSDNLAARVGLAHKVQRTNVPRCQRLDQLIDGEQAALPTESETSEQPSTGQKSAASAQPPTKANAERLAMAKQLVQKIQAEMTSAEKAFGQAIPFGVAQSATEPPPIDQKEKALDEARGAVDRAVEALQALRRLFFSIAEHLRETAERQAELNDQTQHVATTAKAEQIPAETGPLVSRQRELESVASEIASALKKQSEQIPGAGAGRDVDDREQTKQREATSRLLAQAAQLVGEASRAMDQGADNMTQPTLDLKAAREHQDQALKKLLAALALLVPPEQQSGDQTPQEQSQNEDQQEGQQEQQQQPQEKPSPQAGVDAARLLQGVLDREAERRRQNADRQHARHEPVEKDW
jgi:Ca-activated chloride channel family protein